MEKTRLRIRFTKTGDLRWISHRDLARLWERLLRRANLQMAFSEGFHPKPRINFPSALALGIEALEEIVELEVLGQFELPQIEQDIRKQMPDGMELISLESPDYGLGKARVIAASYRIEIPDEDRDSLSARIAAVESEGRVEIQREQRALSCELSDECFALELQGGFLCFTLPVTPQGSLRPAELLEHLGLEDLLESGAVLQRTQVHLNLPEAQPNQDDKNRGLTPG